MLWHFWSGVRQYCVADADVGVTADKFPYLSNNDLKGKAQLSLDEARSFQLLLTGYFSLYILRVLKL